MVGLIYMVSLFWSYLMGNSSAAILVSALLASGFAVLGIRNQRALTRLRETFATINDDNWGKDVIDARRVFTEVKLEVAKDKPSIAKYCVPKEGATPGPVPADAMHAPANEADIHNDKVAKLTIIMSDYETLALGVRHNIVDEAYLYRWMRSVLLEDWLTLSPLVAAHRFKRDNPNVYVEFEGLAAAWRDGRSYRNGAKLKRTNRKIYVR